MSKAELKKTVFDLTEKIGPRPPGSFAELKAANYLKGRFEEIGLNAKIERFRNPSHLAIGSKLSIGDKEFYSLPAQFSASGKVEGKLSFLGNCDLEVKKGDNFSGRIGLLTASGDIPTRTKLFLALEKKGIKGLIVVSPYFDNILTKVVRYPEIKRMPVVIVSYRTACNLKKNEGKRIKLVVEKENKERNASQNVVAKIERNNKNWLVIGSHYDTAPFSPGATDNTSGTAALLELARVLKKDANLNATIYFLATGSEEYGAFDYTGRGAHNFLSKRKKELENCIGYIDTDDMGNLLGTPQIFIGGPGKFRKILLDLPTHQKYQFKGKASIGGDRGVAEEYGIPYLWFTDCRGYRPYYHSPEDKIDFLDFNKLALYVKDIKKVVEGLSNIEPVHRFVSCGNYLIRQARYKDISAILEITKLSFEPVSMDRMKQDLFGEKLGGKDWYEYKNKGVESFCREHIYETIVAEVNHKIVGYATYRLDEERGIAHICNNAVHPGHQGQGIGKNLQKEVKKRMLEEGYTKFAVSTLSNDLPAQKIYEKLGYRKYVESYHYLKKLE